MHRLVAQDLALKHTGPGIPRHHVVALRGIAQMRIKLKKEHGLVELSVLPAKEHTVLIRLMSQACHLL